MQLHHRHPSEIPPAWELPARAQGESPMLLTGCGSEATTGALCFSCTKRRDRLAPCRRSTLPHESPV